LEHGGYLYDSDYYGDELPFWIQHTLGNGTEKNHLIIPYTLDANDMRFASPQGFNTADHFYHYLKDSFDVLYAEGDPNGLNQPKMMSIGMHCRILGRPGRFIALQKFLDYLNTKRRCLDLSSYRYCQSLVRAPSTFRLTKENFQEMNHSKRTIQLVNCLTKEDFIEIFGGVFEHSTWIAERAFGTKPFNSLDDLHAKMVNIVQNARYDRTTSINLCTS
jgi:hypothetical protein